MKCKINDINTDTGMMSSPANILKVDVILNELSRIGNRKSLTKKDSKRIEKLNKDLKKVLSKKKIKME